MTLLVVGFRQPWIVCGDILLGRPMLCGRLQTDGNVEAPMRTVANLGIDSYADPGGGEPPPTPTSPVCDSAFSEHGGCWPCEHRDHSHSHSHSECEAFQPSQPSSGRSSPHWDDDEDDRPHHILSQGLGL